MASWTGAGASELAEWAVLVYVSEDVDLQPLAASYLRCLEVSRSSDKVIAVAEVVAREGHNGGEVQAKRYWYGRGERRPFESVPLRGVSQSARIANLIKWGMGQAVAKRYALVIAGHGRVAPMIGADDGAEESSLSSRDLRTALAVGLADSDREKLDALFLDCCFGATVEVAAELSESVGYLVGTPGLMYSPGLPWDQILGWLVDHPEAEARALVGQAVTSSGDLWGREPELPVALVAIDLSRMPGVGQRLEALAAAARGRLPAAIAEITLARSRAESWGSQSELVDLGGFAAALAAVSVSHRSGISQQAQQLVRAIERAVVASYVQGPLAPWRIRHQGLAVFFPLSVERWPDSYQGAYDEEIQRCWMPFLTSYLGGLGQLLVGELAVEARSG